MNPLLTADASTEPFYAVVGLLCLVVPIVLAVSLLLLRDRRRENKRRRALASGRLPGRETPRQFAQRGTWLLLVVFFTLIFWSFAPTKSHRNRPRPRPTTNTPLLAALIGGSLAAGYALFRTFRLYDRVLKRAEQLVKADDLDGAIATLREAVEVRPTAWRANNLACYLIDKGEWPEAYKYLLEAQGLGLDAALYRNNLSSVLRNLGRPEDSLSVQEPHVHSARATVPEVCNYTLALLDLRRTDAAFEQIVRAETLFRAMSLLPDDQKRLYRALIDLCRSRYEERMGGKKPSPLDEL